MKTIILISSLVLSQALKANCHEEVRMAAINFRAARSSTNTDFKAQAQFLTQRGNKFYYFVQVDVSDNSASDDVNPWIVKVVAKKSSRGCEITQIGF